MVDFDVDPNQIEGWTGKNAAREVYGRQEQGQGESQEPNRRDGLAYGRQLWVYSAEYRAWNCNKLDRAGGLL